MPPTPSCEIVLDITNYKQVTPAPTEEERIRLGEVYYQEKLRSHQLESDANVTKKQFFLAVRWFLEKQVKFTGIPATFSGDPLTARDGLFITKDLTNEDKARFFAIAGLLLAESQKDPLNGKTPEMLSATSGDEIDRTDIKFPVYVAAPFKTAMTRALTEYNTYPKLFDKVYSRVKDHSKTEKLADPFLVAEATVKWEAAEKLAKTSPTPAHKEAAEKALKALEDAVANKTHDGFKFDARQIGEVGRALIGQRTNPDDPQFEVRFERALSTALSGATEGPSSSIDIDLPDLEAGTEADIIADNVKALSAIYFSAMLEELKFFSVMDKVVEQFMNGALPIKRSSAGDPLYRYHRDAQTRINEFERRGLYARSFGVAGGSVDEPMPNREFNDLWIRFLSAVSLFNREQESTERKAVSREQVFKTARDLAVNLSLHGFGLAHFAAVELQNLVRTVKDTLSNVDVLAAYGVRDVWQLVERVSNMYLGGAVNGVRQRTMAGAGAAIIQWLAQSAPNLVGSYRHLLVETALISNVERWLAVTGTPDDAVERYSEPISLSNQRTIPDFAVPAGVGAAGDAIRDALSRVNLPTTPQA